MKMLISSLAVLGLLCSCSQPRFVQLQNVEDPFVMFDNKTGQACYSGSPKALEDRIEAIRRQADANATLSTPPALTAYYFPDNKGGFTAPVFTEVTRQSWEIGKQAEQKYQEAFRLDELGQIPACQSLLKTSLN